MDKSSEKQTEEDKSSSRRKFLVRSGKYALYAAPIAVALLAPRASTYAASATASSSAIS